MKPENPTVTTNHLRRFVTGAYTLAGVYALSATFYLLGQDYSRLAIVGGMSFVCFHMGQKMRKSKSTNLKPLITMFLALAALFLAAAIDYGLDGLHVNAGLNLVASGMAYWVATKVSKR